ncbi:hypothetical protein [Streptomyces sp.]|uniref:hypothetical protein n=1 Tax=Streptomyces sp. TaxID=1931 RepID=UPI002D792BDF|nr:hypothetical protein [Streptomyces sp.]HET6356075.1 hypothetical protein [Streptomyces sp.]
MTLGLIIFPVLALLAGCALVALAPARTRTHYVLPAVRTVALVAVAVIYVTAIWSHS